MVDKSVARFRRKRGWACVEHVVSVECPSGFLRVFYARSTREAAFGENSLQNMKHNLIGNASACGGFDFDQPLGTADGGVNIYGG